MSQRRVDGFPRDLLGGHVLGRPEDGEALLRFSSAAGTSGERHGDAEIEQLERARLRDEQVRRLEIAVHEARRVRSLERQRRSHGETSRPRSSAMRPVG